MKQTETVSEQRLNRRSLGAIGLIVLGALIGLCSILLGADSQTSEALTIYPAFACTLALAGATVLIRTQYLLSHPSARQRARIQEQDDLLQKISLLW